MGSEDGCEEDFEADSSASNNKRVTFSPLIIVLNTNHDSETNRKGTEYSSLKSPDSSDTDSSSLSNSSIDDFIQINSQMFLKPSGENSIPHPTRSTATSHVKEKGNVTNEAFYRLEESTNKSPKSTSQSSDITHESVMENMLPTVFPSVQLMQRSEGFDHNGPPMEGSAASDDSLLSIHVRKKREGASRKDVSLYKSEERSKTGELCQYGVQPNRKSDMTMALGEDVKPKEKGMIDKPKNQVTNIGDSRDSSSKTEKVETSIYPFALSVKKISLYPLCHCHACCTAFHCLRRPNRCSSKWIHWTDCLRNCLSWLGCCCKWPSCYCKCPIWSSCCVKCKY